MKKITGYLVATAIAMALYAVIVFIATAVGAFHQPLTREKTDAAFIDAATEKLKERFVGNFAMAIIDSGAVVAETFHSAGKPVTRQTIFQVSSLSKWISAFGIMTLVEDGSIHLDSPVSRYLSRWQLPASEFDHNGVTVRRLLSHTAGLTDGLGYSGFPPGTTPQSLEASLTQAMDADDGTEGRVVVGIKPGSQFRYSGGGYTLLQLVVEEVSGQSFNDFMHARVFGPLNMQKTTYVVGDSLVPALSEFYHADGTPAEHRRYTSLAATSLYTCLEDLTKFFAAHLKGRHGEPIGRNVLQPSTVRMMRQPHGREMGIDIWGLGTVLYTPTGDDDFIFGHDGRSTPPINTAVRLNPINGDGIIVLETGRPGLATTLASEWVFWKTGQVDTFLFPMLMDHVLWIIGGGWMAIVALGVAAFVWRSRLRRKH